MSITTSYLLALVLTSPVKVSVLTPENYVHKFSYQESVKSQEYKLAQFSDTDSPERSQLLQQVNALYNQRDFKGAEENLRKFIKKFPEDAFGHFQLGNVL